MNKVHVAFSCTQSEVCLNQPFYYRPGHRSHWSRTEREVHHEAGEQRGAAQHHHVTADVLGEPDVLSWWTHVRDQYQQQHETADYAGAWKRINLVIRRINE